MAELAQQPMKPTDVAKAFLDKRDVIQAFVDSLPRGMTVEAFRGAVLLAVAKEPKLVEHMPSLLMSCRQCAADGLMPDGREAALVVYRTQDPPKSGKFINKVQYLPMVAGLIRLARQSGEIGAMSARVVYTSDEFDVEYGDNEHIRHRPNFDDEKPTIRAVYAIAKLRDGSIEREVMTLAQVERIRLKSKAKDAGPWVDHYDEMARKTVLKRILKRLPRSSRLEQALLRVDDGDVQDTTAEHAPERPVLTARTRAAKVADVLSLEASASHETVDIPVGADDVEYADADPAAGTMTDAEIAAMDERHETETTPPPQTSGRGRGSRSFG